MSSQAPDQDVHTLLLEGDLGPRDAGEIHAALLHALQEHRSVVIDTRRLASVDVSIMQLMVAAFGTARRLGHALSVASECGGPLEQSLARGGLTMPPHLSHA